MPRLQFLQIVFQMPDDVMHYRSAVYLLQITVWLLLCHFYIFFYVLKNTQHKMCWVKNCKYFKEHIHRSISSSFDYFKFWMPLFFGTNIFDSNVVKLNKKADWLIESSKMLSVRLQELSVLQNYWIQVLNNSWTK